jgi:hypothetical protein
MGLIVATLAAACALAAITPVARGDGDPGSDVLVYQDLFVGPDAGLSIPQQARFGGLLKAAARSGFPVRVAIIATPSDLGAVTSLWRKPRAYARFLGLELSLAYKQRLLVVMPNGFGFNWPGHTSASADHALANIPIGSGGGGMLAAAQSASSCRRVRPPRLRRRRQDQPAAAAARRRLQGRRRTAVWPSSPSSSSWLPPQRWLRGGYFAGGRHAAARLPPARLAGGCTRSGPAGSYRVSRSSPSS